MPDDIKKSKFQLEYMKATMFGGSWVKDMQFPSFKCHGIKLQAFYFTKALIFIVRLAFLPYLLFKFNVSDKSFIKT